MMFKHKSLNRHVAHGNRPGAIDDNTVLLPNSDGADPQTFGLATDHISPVAAGGQALTSPAPLTGLTSGGPEIPGLTIDGTSDHLINATESSSVKFEVSGLESGKTGIVTFSDLANHQISTNVDADGHYVVDLSSFDDGLVTSSLVVTDPMGQTASADGNVVTLDTDKALTPTVVVNAANPANVTFTISGLEGDEAGTMTFTDAAGHTDVVNIGSNGTYSANLSNLDNGTLSYLVSVVDPAGNTTTFDPTVTLGDGSANAPTGQAQLPNLLNSYSARPPWMVAGVDYAVGPAPGTVFKIPTAGNLPAGATLTSWGIDVTGKNVTLNGYDLSHMTVMVEASASGTITISNCTSTQDVNIRSVVNATANLVVENTILNGGGTASDPNFQTIQVFCPLTVQYCYILNSPAAIGAMGNAPSVIQYNLMQSFDWNPPDHANAIYISGATPSSLIQYNTIWSGDTHSGAVNGIPVPVGIGAAIAAFTDNGSISNTNITNNTVISSLPSAASYLIGFYTYSGAHGYTASGTIENNYVYSVNGFDGTNSGAFGAFYSDYTNVTATVSGNVDMANGNIITSTNTEIAGSTPSLPSGPSAPSISSFSTDSGLVGDHITNDATPTITGTAAANSTVKVYDGATLLGTAVTGGSGAWSFTTASLANGTHNLTAKTTDAAGNTGAASAVFTVTVDTTAPGSPAISSHAVQATNVVTLSGTAEANSTVTVFDGATKLGAVVASTSGTWSFATAPLAAGNHSFTATDSDAAGNTSGPSLSLPLSLTEPVPVNLVAQTSSWSNLSFATQTGNFTASFDATPNQSGSDVVIGLGATNAATYSDLAAIVRFSDNNTIDVRNGGFYGADISVPYIAGTNYHFRMVMNLTTHTYSVFVTPQGGTEIALATNYAFRTEQAADSSLSDLGGFSTTGSATVLNFSVGGTAPPAPTVTSFTPDTGVVGDGITDPAVLTLTGGAVANSTVKVYDGSTLLGSTTANGSGLWSFTTIPLPDGVHKLTATDTVAGVTSAASAVMSVTVDTVAPLTPTIGSFSSDSGVAGDHITNDNTLVLTGTAEANSLVKVYDGLTLLGSAVANGNGGWSYTTSALADGAHSLTATAADAAANSSGPSSALTVSIDTKAPVAPSITSFSPDTGTVGDGTTTANILTLTGTAEANATIKVFDGLTLLGNATANGSGAWTFTTATLANGAHNLTATATDAAGNTSTASGGLNMSVTQPPIDLSVQHLLVNTAFSGSLVGTSEANSIVSVYNGHTGVALGITVTSGAGSWSLPVFGQLNSSVQDFLLKVSNQAGNTGSLHAIFGTTGNDTITAGASNEVLFGNSGTDTFVFSGQIGKDTVADFNSNTDVLQLSHNQFADFAAVLAHASQLGSDVAIAIDPSNSITLHNTTLSQLTNHNIHIV